MTEEQRLKNLCVPTGAIDVVLDTDTFNEIDDQFAIAYLLRAGADIRTAAIYAAPFFNANSRARRRRRPRSLPAKPCRALSAPADSAHPRRGRLHARRRRRDAAAGRI